MKRRNFIKNASLSGVGLAVGSTFANCKNVEEKVIPVTLIKLETYEIDYLGLEVKNANKTDLKDRGISHGVIVTRPLTRDIAQYNLTGVLVTHINDLKVSDIDDVKRIMTDRKFETPIKVTFVDQNGELNKFIFR